LERGTEIKTVDCEAREYREPRSGAQADSGILTGLKPSPFFYAISASSDFRGAPALGFEAVTHPPYNECLRRCKNVRIRAGPELQPFQAVELTFHSNRVELRDVTSSVSRNDARADV
jgi:hypothetical protein